MLNTIATTARQARLVAACVVAFAGCRGSSSSPGTVGLGSGGTPSQGESGGAGASSTGGRATFEPPAGSAGEDTEAAGSPSNQGGTTAGAASKPRSDDGGSGESGEAGASTADAGQGGEVAEPAGAAGRNDTSNGGDALGGAAWGGAAGRGDAAGRGGVVGQGGLAGQGGAGGTIAGGNSAGATAGDGAGGTAGDGTAGQSGSAGCTFTVTATTSASMPTVATVEWTTTLPDVASAEILYTLDTAAEVLNGGGRVRANLAGLSARTLLLGLKQESRYVVRIEAETKDGTRCSSGDYALDTGTLADAPAIARTVLDATRQAVGFITTSGGVGSSAPVVVLDADGSVVWSAAAPPSCSRARVDYEHEKMWMLGINAANKGGDLRSLSLDGTTTQANLPGLERAHHDFTLLPGGTLAVFAWSGGGLDPESELLEVASDGSVKKLFHVGTNLYAGGQSAYGGSGKSYHCNSVTYRRADDSFVIGDRNPNLFVKVARDGAPEWQFGGSCAETKAPRCVSGSWQVNHGHHLLDDGTFVLFNNTGFGATSTPSNALEFKLEGGDSMVAFPVKEWAGGGHEHSDTLGDIQRLPNGNTLVTFSNNGVIYEVDSAWNVVQTLSAPSFGYAEWRPSLYEAPSR